MFQTSGCRRFWNNRKTFVWNILQDNKLLGDSIMIGYKKGILEKLSHLQARMGQGAPLTQYHIKEITIWAQQSVCFLSMFRLYTMSDLFLESGYKTFLCSNEVFSFKNCRQILIFDLVLCHVLVFLL